MFQQGATIEDIPIAAFDTETTSADPLLAEPVSAAVVIDSEGSRNRHPLVPSLIAPRAEIEPGAQAVHGIDPEAARAYGAHLPNAVGRINDALLDACFAGCVLVAANAQFDLTVLERTSRRCGVPTLHERAERVGARVCVFDPMLADRWWDRYRKGPRRLGDLCLHYGVAFERAHDAEADAVAAADLARALLLAAVYPERGPARLVSGPWERERAAELRACADADDLHALMARWRAESREDYESYRRRSEPGFCAPAGWPVLEG